MSKKLKKEDLFTLEEYSEKRKGIARKFHRTQGITHYFSR